MARLPYLSARLQGFGTTIFAEMSALAARTEAINLGQGFPDTDGPAEVSAAAIKAIEEGRNQYPPGPGTADLRLAISEHQRRFWSMDVDPDTEVLVTAGATEAIAATMLALCEVGDEVVVFDPTYDSYGASIAMAGAKLKPVLLHPPQPGESAYRFDPDELRAAFSAKTRLLLLNTPHNPTGKVFTHDELTLVAELCQEYDVVAVTDEVYEHLVFDGRHHPLATLPGMMDRTVSISSGGKTFSFTGWKIGWATARPELIAAIRTAKQFLTFVNGAPFQPAIAIGLRLGDDYYQQFKAELEAKRDLLGEWLDRAGLRVHQPQGTYFTTVDIGPLGETSGVDFCLALPEQAGVVAVPSQVFYQDQRDGATQVRFCFAKRDEVITEAGQRLVSALAPA